MKYHSKTIIMACLAHQFVNATSSSNQLESDHVHDLVRTTTDEQLTQIQAEVEAQGSDSDEKENLKSKKVGDAKLKQVKDQKCKDSDDEDEICLESELNLKMLDPSAQQEFTDFALTYHKNVKSLKERQKRFKNFLKSKKKMKKFKKKRNKTSTVALNELCDLDEEELSHMLSLKLSPQQIHEDEVVDQEYEAEQTLKLKSFSQEAYKINKQRERISKLVSDTENEVVSLAETGTTTEQYEQERFWTSSQYNYVLDSMQNQGSCGSCWAFTAVESLQSAYALKTGVFVSLSQQYCVDCLTYGCQGGLITPVFDHSLKYPIPERLNYREYDGKVGTCEAPIGKLGVSVNSHTNVAISAEELKHAVLQQPVAAAVKADSEDFLYYSKGIISGEDCGHAVNHAVSVVGYGFLNTGDDYFLVKNSWGSGWGDRGYVRISASLSTHRYGVCGIRRLASYPVVNDLQVKYITGQPTTTT